MATIRIKRGTRAQIDDAAAAGGLAAGAPYLITDEGRLAVGTAANAYSAAAKQSEAARPPAFAAFVGGKPTASEVVALIAVPVACTLPAGLTGSIVKAGVAATASAALSVRKNGSQFGTATFAAAGTTATLAVASATTFAAGDLLSIVAPASADATLADIAITLVGA